MRREWIVATELATLKIGPADAATLGMRAWPATARGINKRAVAAGWEGRKSGSAQVWEYRLAALPAIVQRAAARATLTPEPDQLTPPATATLPDPGSLRDYQRSRLEARAAICAEIDRIELTGLSRGRAVEAVIGLAARHELPPALQALVPVANARSNGDRTLTRATLYNWLKARDLAGSPLALARVAVAEAPIPGWAETLMRLYGRPSKPALTACLDQWPAEAGAAPSYWQAQRFLGRLDAISRNVGRMGPRALKALRAYKARDVSELWPGAVFIGDGHTFKAEVAHPDHGRPFRPEITLFADVFTRRIVGWSIALAENTLSVADALRHAVMTTTTPDILYYDNGSGAKNAAWDDDVTGLAARLSITKMHSLPYNSQARGVIERLNSTALHRAAKKLPTYVGQDQDREARLAGYKITRREVRATGTSRLLPTWPELMEFLTAEIAAYNNRPHTSLAKIVGPVTLRRRHLSPQEAWDRAVADGWQPDPIPADEALDLFRPVVRRQARRALVSLWGNDYFLPALEALHGEDVQVGYDIHDASAVTIRTLDGRLIGKAIWNGHRTSYVPVTFAQDARERRVEGKLRRLEAHADTAYAELSPAKLIEHKAPAPLSLEIIEGAERQFARLAEASSISIDLALAADPAARPHSGSDLDLTRWMLAHPDQLDADDADYLRDLLRHGSFRLLAQVNGVDLDALRALSVPPAQRINAA